MKRGRKIKHFVLICKWASHLLIIHRSFIPSSFKVECHNQICWCSLNILCQVFPRTSLRCSWDVLLPGQCWDPSPRNLTLEMQCSYSSLIFCRKTFAKFFSQVTHTTFMLFSEHRVFSLPTAYWGTVCFIAETATEMLFVSFSIIWVPPSLEKQTAGGKCTIRM